MLKPSVLRPGDRIAAVSLSWGGPSSYPHRYEAGKRQFEESFGVKVVEARHTMTDHAWLASHLEARASDLMEAFTDPSIQGIVSTIGGDDSIRLLPFLDLAVIRENPKVFLGYSDTTVTHFACMKAGLVTFYGPAIMAGFSENGGLFPYMTSSIRRTLFSAEAAGPEYRRLDLRAPRLGRSCTPKSKAPPSSLFGLAVAARGWDTTGQIDRRVFGGS